MAFCQYCGQQIPDNANACPYCGKFVKEQAAPQQEPAQPNYQQAPQQGYAQPNYQQAPPAQPAYMTPEMDVQQSRGLAWLSYVGLLFLIPMFVKKYSDYTRFHVKQGATLCATWIAYGITQSILLATIGAIFPGETYNLYYITYTAPSTIYTISSVLLGLAHIFLTVLAIIGIVNAASGKRNELPLIGKIPWIATLLDNTVYK